MSSDYTFALSVSADHLLGKYDLAAEVRCSSSYAFWRFLNDCLHRMAKQKRYALNTLDMARSRSRMAVVYVRPEDGMGSTPAFSLFHIFRADYMTPVSGCIRLNRSNPSVRSAFIAKALTASSSPIHPHRQRTEKMTTVKMRMRMDIS